MTHSPRIPSRTAARLRRFGLAVSVVVVAMGLTVPMSAGAATRTSSAVVAEEAGRAVAALESWQVTQNPADYVRFVQARERTADVAAAELDADGEALLDGWTAASVERQRVVLSALTQLGVPYRYATSQPGVAFDCSGLTRYAYREIGIDISNNSRDQIRASTDVDADQAAAGDLVYYPGHIALYLGAGLMVHAPNSNSRVEVAYLSKRSLRYGAVVGEEPAPAPSGAAPATASG